MKTATIVQDGPNQAVTLPEEFRVDGEKVYINKVGNVVVLIPETHPWKSLFASLDQFTDDYMDEREQPQIQSREEIFG
jgi:antitoxin VapB